MADEYNAVQVRVSRSNRINGQVPLFFARAVGHRSAEIDAQAVAGFVSQFRGFRAPDTGRNLPLLPFALDESSFSAMLRGEGPDDYTDNGSASGVSHQSDGHVEVNLYPLETGSAGNCGTVDIGGNNSNTPTLRRQIVEGITPQELEFHGGELAFDEGGNLKLSADPGLKAGAIESELKSIIGQPRIIPIYRSVKGGGNPGEFDIVGFAGVSIVSVELTGADKNVRIQACPQVVRGGIPAAPNQATSQFLYSPVALVQ
jgi:hypothetical protein